jgi:cell division protein FtsI (penicillin-binding protein 3)
MVKRRLSWIAAIVAGWCAIVFFKLVSLQVIHHEEYVRQARARQQRAIEVPAPRGAIFDRNGRALALSTPTVSVYLNPKKVPDFGVAAQILAAELHLNQKELYAALVEASENGRGYLIIKRKASYEEAERLRSLNLEWVSFLRESQRNYPNGTLAAHVIGGVDFEEKGNAGIEKALDEDLRGHPGKLLLLTDVKQRGIDHEMESEARPGIPITLSIDERIQYVAEQALAAAIELKHAVSGSLVVMNPHTGDILALVSLPTYDPNKPPQPGEPLDSRRNHAIAVPFEPGSIFKVFNFSAALETTSLRPDTPINCHGGVLKLPGRIIHDSHLGKGILPMETVLAVSSNIGAIEVGMRVGNQNMYDYVRKFGFGQKTGISLPGESGGKLRKVKNWGTTSLASISMGQEVSVTTVQLAQAGSVLANGGVLVRPRLVLKKGDQVIPPSPGVRVINGDTTITMRRMMEGVVLHGTGTGARLQGYSVGGKTGSAQIFDFATRHYTHSYNASFMGFAPLTNPAVVIVVTLNGTHGTSGFGGPAAAPVFKAVGTEALRVLEVPKDVPEESPLPVMVSADVSDLADPDTESLAQNILEDGEEDPIPLHAFVGPRLEGSPAAAVLLPKAPNFVGKSMRAVLAEASAKGLMVSPNGSGIARGQYPPPGAAVHEGERIRVRFTQ